MVESDTEVLKHVKGKCFCGQVEFTVDKLPQRVHTCHCDTCRTISGGPAFRNHSLPTDEITCSDWDSVSIFQSSEKGERGFCSNCGTHLFYRSRTKPSMSLSIELFREHYTNVVFEAELYCSSKPDYYSFENDTEKLDKE